MPIFLAALLGGLVSAAGSIVGRVLIALGIGYVSYSGFSVLFGWIKSAIFQNLMALNPTVIGILGTLQVDVAVNIIFSAIAARFVVAGITGGSLTRMVIK